MEKDAHAMRDLTVNQTGKQINAICLFCHKDEVAIEDWNKRCLKCKAKVREKEEIEKKQLDMGIGKRMPAARIVTEDGREVWVDKFGREVDNPGYDLKNDPRGWQKTGTQPKERTLIK